MGYLTFYLLGLAIVAAWGPSVRVTERFRFAPWTVFFIASAVSANLGGVAKIDGIFVLSIFALICLLSQISASKWIKLLSTGVACAMALGLAFRLFPGFPDQIIYEHILVSADAAPFRLNLNYGKGCAGLFLLAFYSRKISSWSEAAAILESKIWYIVLGTPLAVLLAATIFGGIRFDPKWPEPTLAFLASNLFFTCVAEEAFFRGFLQERLHKAFGEGKVGRWIPMLLISIGFAALHLNANISYFLFVAIAGFGYSYSYFYFRRIEPAIITHFLVNSLHFLFFTYPHLAKAT